MTTPLTLRRDRLPLCIGGAPVPDFIRIEVEGLAQDIPFLMARALRSYGFEVTEIVSEQRKDETDARER